MRLPRNFFEQKTLKVAKQLLGCFLIRKIGPKKIVAQIIETEAYCGPHDLANHASRGRTKRTEVMFKKAGHAYVYLIYGMYYCFNIVTEKEGYPAAVLIRGVELTDNLKLKTKNLRIIGPGKVCRELKINKGLNGIDLIKSKELWVEKNNKRLPFGLAQDKKDCPSTSLGTGKIKRLTRVGVDYAGAWAKKKWRFILHHFCYFK